MMRYGIRHITLRGIYNVTEHNFTISIDVLNKINYVKFYFVEDQFKTF